jgi:ankyrin repeat protein
MGRTPLHILASRIDRHRLDLLDCLLAVADNKDLTIQDCDGNTPLHLSWYLWSRKDALVTRRLFDAYPQAALIANSDGELPIHCIVIDYDYKGTATQSTMKEIEDTVEAMISFFKSTSDPESDDFPLLMCDEGGCTPLLQACIAQHGSIGQSLIPLLLKACPRAARVTSGGDKLPLGHYLGLYSDEYDDDEREQPTINRMQVDTLLMLLEANPHAAAVPKTSDEISIYPLHYCAREWPLDAVRAVYEAYPDAVRMKSGENPLEYALDYATMNQCPIEGPKIIRFLHEKFPMAARCFSDESQKPSSRFRAYSPLHHFALHSSLESIKTLCELEPIVLKSRDSSGLTPLLRLVYKIKWDIDINGDANVLADSVLRLFLRNCPEAAAIKGDGGLTPYSFATEVGLSEYFRRLLLRAAPEVDITAYHELNYSARRGALYLLYAAIPGDEKAMSLWLKLREGANDQLIRMVASFL